ncbi:protein of unknown function [Burkholderia multivorans]
MRQINAAPGGRMLSGRGCPGGRGGRAGTAPPDGRMIHVKRWHALWCAISFDLYDTFAKGEPELS